jgi:hypothetical protein
MKSDHLNISHVHRLIVNQFSTKMKQQILIGMRKMRVLSSPRSHFDPPKGTRTTVWETLLYCIFGAGGGGVVFTSLTVYRVHSIE